MKDRRGPLAKERTSLERNVAFWPGDRYSGLANASPPTHHINRTSPLVDCQPSLERRNVMVGLANASHPTHRLSEGQAIFLANKGTIVLVLTVFVLVVYAIAGYATPKLIANSDSLLSSTLHDL